MGIATIPAASSGGAPGLFSRSTMITTTATFIHPDVPTSNDPKTVYVIAVGGGGGGGTGGLGMGTSNFNGATGGTGGGAGGISHGYVPCQGSLSVVVGAGGAGGAAISTSLSSAHISGNNGAAGGVSLVNNGAGFLTLGPGGGGGTAGEGGSGGINNAPAVALRGPTPLAPFLAINDVAIGTFNTATIFGISNGGQGGGGGATNGNEGGFVNRPTFDPILGYVGTSGAGGGATASNTSNSGGTVQNPLAINTYLLGKGGAGSGSRNDRGAITAASDATGFASGGGGCGGTVSCNTSTAFSAVMGKGGDGSPGFIMVYF